MKIIALAFFALVSTAFATDPKDTMCVKQKDGTYKCKASGKIEKVPCCDTPTNEPTATPKPKRPLPKHFVWRAESSGFASSPSFPS